MVRSAGVGIVLVKDRLLVAVDGCPPASVDPVEPQAVTLLREVGLLDQGPGEPERRSKDDRRASRWPGRGPAASTGNKGHGHSEQNQLAHCPHLAMLISRRQVES